MQYQLDKPPTREAMCEEFGVNPERLELAEEYIRRIAKSPDDWDWGKGEFDTGDAASLLVRFGMLEAFALFCLRAGEEVRRCDILLCPDLAQSFVDVVDWWGQAYRFSAEFDSSGRLKFLGVTKVEPMPFKYGDFFTVVRFPLSRSQSYRKLLAERWFDPDVPHLERFVCPLDRKHFENWRQFLGKSKNETVKKSAGTQADPKP